MFKKKFQEILKMAALGIHLSVQVYWYRTQSIILVIFTENKLLHSYSSG